MTLAVAEALNPNTPSQRPLTYLYTSPLPPRPLTYLYTSPLPPFLVVIKDSGRSTHIGAVLSVLNVCNVLNVYRCSVLNLKGIYARFPLAGFDSIFKFSLTWSPFSYSMTLDAYHIDSVNTCYD